MKVKQIKLTIQGEGYLLGFPSILIRLCGCNLNCPYCDTKWALSGDSEEYTPQELFNLIQQQYFKNYDIEFYPNIMFTGGEPLLYITEIKSFIDIYNKFLSDKSYLTMPIVDIETNGLLLTRNFLTEVFYETELDININISPKLQTDCYKKNMTIDNLIAVYSDFENEFNVHYKIVYKKEWENDITRFITELKLNKHNVKIMPFMDINNNQQFFQSNMDTVDYCIRKGIPYTPRHHIYLFGNNSLEFEDLKK